jgi:4'-phosphopantetheinyl transferase
MSFGKPKQSLNNQTVTMPKTIYWMLVDSAQIPSETRTVLSPSELARFSAFRFPKRRLDWLLGRWAAKSLAHSLPACQNYPLDQIEIRNTPQGAPFIQLEGQAPLAECLTISHREHLALCALASAPNLRVGADLEKIEPRTETFILDYFTPAECRLVDACPAETRPVMVTLIWSAKEAMLKALGVGLRWDTRMVEVCGLDGLPPAGITANGWQEIRVAEKTANDRVWAAWWQCRNPFVLTLAGFILEGFTARHRDMQSVQLVEKKLG